VKLTASAVRKIAEALGYEISLVVRKDQVPWRICRSCSYTWPRGSVRKELDEDGRFLGWLCEDCS
jgi:hypothetical protein